MKEPERIISDNKPSIVGYRNNKWYYNYDIKSFEAETVPGTRHPAKKITRYKCIQVTLDEKPTYKKCVELIIRKFVSQTQEFDLVNSANKAILSGAKSSEDITKYKEYLDKVEEIKEQVEKDLGK